jgi:hypothetical protein
MKTFEKLSEEIAAKMAESLAGLNIKEFVEKTKAADDSGTFEVVITTDNEDRQGEILDQNGLDTKFYLTNPVVLWAHDYHSLPIGITESIVRDGNKTIAKGKFAPAEANPFAQQVRKLYDAKIVRTTSVGFIAKEMKGNVVTLSELLEFSFVPVPANPYALSMRSVKELGLDCEMIKAKGLEIKEDEKEPEAVTPAPEIIEPVEKEKAGRVLSEKNRGAIQGSIDSMKSSIAALEELLSATEPQGGEGKAQADPDEKSKPAGSEDIVKGIKDYGDMRQVLRMISTVTSDALQKFNENHRKKSVKK